MSITVQVDLHATIQEVFGEKTIRVALNSPQTVRHLLAELCTSRQRHAQIFTDSGELRNDVKILRNGRNIVFLDNLDTELNNGDIIAVFPPVVGG
ncbi:MAG: MoaD family protein [Desulfobacterales bacterium]|nr:MAG: MoaD family protein [Desulfobacterales bacterium]